MICSLFSDRCVDGEYVWIDKMHTIAGKKMEKEKDDGLYFKRSEIQK